MKSFAAMVEVGPIIQEEILSTGLIGHEKCPR